LLFLSYIDLDFVTCSFTPNPFIILLQLFIKSTDQILKIIIQSL